MMVVMMMVVMMVVMIHTLTFKRDYFGEHVEQLLLC